MLAEIVAVALIAAAPTATSTPTSTATPAAAPTSASTGPTAPLREVVYRVSTSERVDENSESYGGYNAAAPASAGIASKNGSVTVDVLAKFENGDLAIRVLELWQEVIGYGPTPRLPQKFTGAVRPDGTVEFPPATIDPVTIELLPFFATRFTPAATLVPGTHWSVERVYEKASVTTDYSVTAVGPSSVSIRKVTKIQALGYETIDGTVAYDPSSFVPISGKIIVTRNDTFASGQMKHTLDLIFDRVSDTDSASSKP